MQKFQQKQQEIDDSITTDYWNCLNYWIEKPKQTKNIRKIQSEEIRGKKYRLQIPKHLYKPELRCKRVCADHFLKKWMKIIENM